MSSTTKNQRRVIYTIIDIAKSTLYTLYYKQIGKITESRVYKPFCLNTAKVRAVIPKSLKQELK